MFTKYVQFIETAQMVEKYSHCLGISYYICQIFGGLGSNEFQNKMTVWHPWQLKKIKILGAVLELPAKQHCRFSPFDPFSW